MDVERTAVELLKENSPQTIYLPSRLLSVIHDLGSV